MGSPRIQPRKHASPAPAAHIPARVQKVFDHLTDVMFDHSGRVWPGYDWRKFQFMVIDETAHKAYLWNDGGARPGQEPRVSVFDSKLVPEDDKNFDWAWGKWHGIDTTFIP